MAVKGFDWFSVIIIVGGGFLLYQLQRIFQFSPQFLHYRLRQCLPQSISYSPKLLGYRSWREWMDLSIGEVTSVLLVILFLIIRFVQQFSKLSANDKLEVKAVIPRSFGELLFVMFAFLIFPIMKHSSVLKLLGISFERAVKFHRGWAVATILVMTIHGVGMWISYAVNNEGVPFSKVLRFAINPATGWSNLSGFISYCFIILLSIFAVFRHRKKNQNSVPHPHPAPTTASLTATSNIRKEGSAPIFMLFQPMYKVFDELFSNYDLFHTVHIVCAILIFIFAGLHMPTLLVWMYPAIALYGIDFIIVFCTRYVIKSTHIIEKKSLGNSSEVTKISVLFTAKDSFVNKLNYEAGQYFFLIIPSISLWERHPFSVSSANPSLKTSSSDEVLTFHMRNMGENTWTNKLASLVNFNIGEDNQSLHLPLTIYLDGPFGKPSVDLQMYESLILYSGGKCNTLICIY